MWKILELILSFVNGETWGGGVLGRVVLVACDDSHVCNGPLCVSEEPAGTIIMIDDGGNRFAWNVYTLLRGIRSCDNVQY